MAEYTTIQSKPRGLATVELSNLGATLVSYTVHAPQVNVVCGFKNPEHYRDASNPYFGTTVGRVANRIQGGLLALNGKEYKIPANERGNVLHGGAESYHLKLFDAAVSTDGDAQVVTYTLLDTHKETSFPGTVQVTAKYTLHETGENSIALDVEYSAVLVGDADETLINLTNHSYFNVTGNPSIDGMQVKLATDKYMAVDDELIPTGEIQSHPLFADAQDKAVTLGAESGIGGSSDHCFVLDSNNSLPDTRRGELALFATLSSDKTGVTLTASTTEPSFQFYTGDGTNVQLAGEPRTFGNRSGVCLEAARYVDAARFPAWASQTRVQRGQTWGSLTRYAVSYSK
ncbi:galactose mutarotase-like domain-containing protein [Protomyces lactucae-debilis]|uniref:Galactose mutarotase-like domain-containing protein n=1 Tax=Protomyces lactucae-debilis TaxID=2754530 RepID=A0A1Y2EXB5_PROLT|nr:galactose mutarotase-like domain-containing protein [Protomyces lactucae-debilis]ORY75455.1 galactose mutarotase-like domain-containing protein [Protomyces lactucae-debilis]